MKEKEENTDLRFVPSYHFQVTFFGDDQKKAEEISKEQAEKEKAKNEAVKSDKYKYEMPKPVELAFRDVSGLSIELQTEEVRSGGENLMSYKLPKPIKYGTLKLSRALKGQENMDRITDWAEKAIYYMDIKLKTVQVSLLNEKHVPVRTWSFVDAYPVKLNISEMNATKSEISIETLELVYKYSRRDK